MTKLIKDITLGSDPEFGIIDGDGTPVSGVGFLPGTKNEPFPMNEFVSCQTDNVGAETCIPPVDNIEDWVKYIQMSRDMTEEKLREVKPEWSLVSISSARYSAQELDSEQARAFGCDPSYDIYTESISKRPSPEEVGSLRSFGFHVHIGFNITEEAYALDPKMDSADIAHKLVRAMDICLGVPSIFMDTDGDRRAIYGNGGDFRLELLSNGVNKIEYRTIGGAMHATEELIRFVYQQTMKAIFMVNNWEESFMTSADEARDIINTGNCEAAISFCKFNNVCEVNEQQKEIYSVRIAETESV